MNYLDKVSGEMNESKLVLALKSLSQEEFRIFKRFLSSKMFNHNERVIALYDILRKQLNAGKPNFSKKSVHNQLFGDVPFDAKSFRNLMSYLMKCLEKFFVYQELHQEKSAELLALSRSYRKRNLNKLFEKAVKETETILEQIATRDVQYHQWNYQLEIEKCHALLQQKRAAANNLQLVSDRLDVSYFADRLRQSCLMLAHKTVYNTNYNLGMIKHVVKEVEEQQLLDLPAIGIYYYLYKAQTNEDNLAYFKSMQHHLITSAHLFDNAEMQDIYLLAINIAIKNLNQGRTELMKELLELYQNGIEKKILLTNDILSRFTYKNTIALALQLSEFDWATQFIEKYKMNLEPKYREETYGYNLAKLHYTKKEYQKALHLLAVTSLSDDMYINLDTKILLSRIFFEQNEFDALESVLNSFKVYIHRKKMIGYQRQVYQNFVTSIHKLISHNNFDRTATKKLKEEIKATQPLPDKYWFLAQI